jgi:hypothetical protein
MVRIVIHVRYKSLSPGMHAEAECRLRGIVVYLLPGLTSAQRKAALRRLRQEGSRGCGPRLPSAQLAAALVVDRMRSGIGSIVAAVRQHPVGALLPAVLAGGLLAAFVYASVPVRMTHAPVPGSAGAASWSVTEGTPGQGGPPAGMPSNAPGFGAPSSVSLTGGPPPGRTATGIRPGTKTGTSPVTWAVAGAGPAANADAAIAALHTPAVSAGHPAKRSPAGHGGSAGQGTPTGQGTPNGQYAYAGQGAPTGQSWPAVRVEGGEASTSALPAPSAPPAQEAPAQPTQVSPPSSATRKPRTAPAGHSAPGTGSAPDAATPEPGAQPGG